MGVSFASFDVLYIRYDIRNGIVTSWYYDRYSVIFQMPIVGRIFIFFS